MADVPRGRFVWYELLTSDTDGAVEFYENVLGWGTEMWEGSGDPYQMWTTGHGSIGGVMPLPPEAREAGAPPHWMAYVATSEVDATAALAAEMGAKVLVPAMDIPDVGRFCVLQDPAGAVFSVFRPEGDAPGHEGPARVGEVSWHELMTDDQEEAFRFYSQLFGWEKGDAMDMGEMGVYQIFQRAGAPDPLGGMMNKPAEMPVAAWLYYVRVGDLDATLERVEANGGAVLNGPMEVPGGDRVAQCQDPQGAHFAVHWVASA
jgi:predicted enzyme related to lactoylglutathione lyase